MRPGRRQMIVRTPLRQGKPLPPLLRGVDQSWLFSRKAVKGNRVTHIECIQRRKQGVHTLLSVNIDQTLKSYRVEMVRWVSESLRPFSIVEDRGFQCLMKTGRPDYYLPSISTVARDVRLVFSRTRERIAKLLQVCFSLQGYPVVG
jgi:hypothetical protein